MRTTYFDIDDRTDELRKLLHRHKDKAKAFSDRFEVAWIYHENALEGLVLDLVDLKAALEHSMSEEGVLIPTYQRIRNLKTAIEKIRDCADETDRGLSLSFIKNLHAVLSIGLNGDPTGLYRREMPIHRNYFHDITPPARIATAMIDLVKYLKSKEFRQFHPFQQGAEIHFRMMQVFPFEEENGKLARLMMNAFILRAGYFPVIIPDVERQRYYDSLRIGSEVLHSLIVDCTARALQLALRFF